MSMQESLQIFTASSGKPSARVVINDTTTRHLHSTVKPESESDFFKNLSFWGNVIVFTGTGLGYHLAGKIKEIPSSALVVIIDFYDKLIEHCMDNIFVNLPNDIITVSSSNYQEKKPELVKKLKALQSPLIQTVKHPASFDIHKSFYENVLSTIFSSAVYQQPKEKIQKKILLLYGKFFLQEETRRAIAELNKEDPILFEYESIQSDMEYESRLQKIIQTEKPDLILSINMKGFDSNGILSNASSQFEIPVIVWFVDDPHPILIHQSAFVCKQMSAMYWEKSYIPYLEKQGFSKVSYLPLATDPSIFSQKMPVSPEIPLGFIGSSMAGEFLENIKSKFLWSDSLIPLVENASDFLLNNPAKCISEIINDMSSEMSVKLPFSDRRNYTWLCSYIIHTASMKKRKNIINSLLTLDINTFGDPEGWKELIGKNIITHPNIDYKSQLCGMYRNIIINLNITSCQMSSAVNQRVFDIPMSGSFVISDNQKDMEELFDIGKEAVCYNEINELKDLIVYYTKHETTRNEIIDNAMKRIKNQHTYINRIESIFNLVWKQGKI